MNWRILRERVLLAGLALLSGCGAPARDDAPVGDPEIVVTTAYSGASPIEVESTVTIALEQALRGVPGIRKITATSREGESVVRLEISPDRDVEQVKQAVAEALNRVAANLPAESGPPILAAVGRDVWPGILLTLTSQEDALIEVQSAAQSLREQLLQTPHVEEVRIFGGQQRELQVRCDPRRLQAHRLSFPKLLETVSQVARARTSTVEDLGKAAVATRDGAPVLVRDVAEIRLGLASPESLAWLDSRPAIVIGVFVQPAEAAATLQRLDAELARVERELPERVSLTRAQFPAPASAAKARGGLLAELHAPPGVSVEQLRELSKPLRQGGAAGAGADGGGAGVVAIWTRSASAEMQLWFAARKDASGDGRLLAALRQQSQRIPGIRLRVAPAGGGLIGWRPRYDIDLSLLGPDRELLASWSAAVVRRLAEQGFGDVVDEPAAAAPRVAIKLDRDRLARLGVDANSVAQCQLASTVGVAVAVSRRGEPPIRVFLASEDGPGDPASTLVPAGDSLIPLSAVADMTMSLEPSRLQRRSLRPSIRVTAAAPPHGDSAEAARSASRIAAEVGRQLQLTEEYVVEGP